MFKLTCKINIGIYSFTAVNEIKIKRSIHTFIDTATIKIPATVRLKQTGTSTASASQKAADKIKEGDCVQIQLGYNDLDQIEFDGFVKRVNASTPCEIECEGYSWQLRKKSIAKGFPKTTLRDLLAFVIKDTGIKLSDQIPDVPLSNIYIKNENALDVLTFIKEKLFMTVYFMGKELYAGLAYLRLPKGPGPSEVIYEIGNNVVKDNELKFRKADDIKVKIKTIHFTDRNHPVVGEAGDSEGAIRTIFVQEVANPAKLKELAERKLKDLKYDGYEGKITAFLQPFALPGTKVVLRDKAYKEREGSYLLESTEVSFGLNGARRICEIGPKISKNNE